MGLNILGIDHVVIRCNDLKRMTAFYCDVVGCTLDRWREELGLVHLRAGNAFIDLADAEKARQRAGTADRPSSGAAADAANPNMDHLCLTVGTFDIEAVNAHLMAHGLPAGEGHPGYRQGSHSRPVPQWNAHLSLRADTADPRHWQAADVTPFW